MIGKRCSCGAAEADGAEFYERSHQCKPCARRRSKAVYRADPEKANRLRRARHLRKRYHLSPAEYDDMLAAQGGGCALCGTTTPGGAGNFHVDHDHKCCPGKDSCGKCVRGLLCNDCNTRVVPVLEDRERAERGLAYIAREAVPYRSVYGNT